MDIKPISISLVCLFCGGELEAPDDAEFQSGDLIKCQSCGEQNDYDSLVEVAKEKGVSAMKLQVEEQIKKEFSGLFKK